MTTTLQTISDKHAVYARKGDECAGCDEINGGSRTGWMCGRIGIHGPICPWCVGKWRLAQNQRRCLDEGRGNTRRLEALNLPNSVDAVYSGSTTGPSPEWVEYRRKQIGALIQDHQEGHSPQSQSEIAYLLRNEAVQQIQTPKLIQRGASSGYFRHGGEAHRRATKLHLEHKISVVEAAAPPPVMLVGR